MIARRPLVVLGAVVAAALAFAVANVPGASVATAAAVPPPPSVSREQALQSFETVRAVLQHPRCQNCHIPGDAPLQLDSSQPHLQNVLRGPDGRGAAGLPCATCHAAANPPASYGAHTPPGAPDWHLPPPDRKLVFIGLSAADLCATVKDPKRNGGKDAAALLEHVDHDKLVLWGWDPGAGRAPVSTPHDEFVRSMKTWIDGGMPCPAAPRAASASRSMP